jgi:hypothetical protein
MSIPFKFKTDPLKFDSLIDNLKKVGSTLPDPRTGCNGQYSMKDAVLSAFSVFFTQSPSFLSFQRDMERRKGKNNASSFFGAFKIPTDAEIRNLMDTVDPHSFFSLFIHVFEQLVAVGALDQYRTAQGKLLLSLDGVYYFASDKIHCQQCRTQTHKNGTTSYSHVALATAITGVNQPVVFPLPPEFLTPQDGHDKQDSEIAAANRWLEAYAPLCKAYDIVLLADDIFCHDPFCKQLMKVGVEFIFTCKPDSHETLYEWVDDFERRGNVEHLTLKKWDGKQHLISTYRIARQVPLRNTDDALLVNFFESTVHCEETGNILHHNAFATPIDVTVETVEDYTMQARTRWKIENENNNTLKNQGYHLTHNFGHGAQFLSMTLLTLNLLAFLYHGVLALMDVNYQLVRKELGTRETFFNDVKALTRYHFFESFQALLTFMREGLEIKSTQKIGAGCQTL